VKMGTKPWNIAMAVSCRATVRGCRAISSADDAPALQFFRIQVLLLKATIRGLFVASAVSIFR
jgi:hypothetical protein